MATNNRTNDCLLANLLTHKYTIENHEIKNEDGNSRTHLPLAPGFPVTRRDKKWNATIEMVAKNESNDNETKYKYLFELGATSKYRRDISKASYQIKLYTQRRNGSVQFNIANFKGDAKMTDDGSLTVKETLDAADLLKQVEKKWGSPELCIEFEITEVKKKRSSTGKPSSAKKSRPTDEGHSYNSAPSSGTRSHRLKY